MRCMFAQCVGKKHCVENRIVCKTVCTVQYMECARTKPAFAHAAAQPQGYCALMAWRCDGCTRYWGHCRKACPLCNARVVVRMLLRRSLPAIATRELIHDFLGSKGNVRPLPKRSLCRLGTARNCRCNHCRIPAERQDDRILHRLARKSRGRAAAARWVHLLSGTVALRAGHGILHGMLIAAGCGRGPHVSLLSSRVPRLLSNDVRPWVWRWLTAVFLQYVKDRCDLRGLLGTAASVLPNISIS